MYLFQISNPILWMSIYSNLNSRSQTKTFKWRHRKGNAKQAICLIMLRSKLLVKRVSIQISFEKSNDRIFRWIDELCVFFLLFCVAIRTRNLSNALFEESICSKSFFLFLNDLLVSAIPISNAKRYFITSTVQRLVSASTYFIFLQLDDMAIRKMK